MATSTKTNRKTDPFAKAKVPRVVTTKGETAGPVFVMTASAGYNDAAAIDDVQQLIKENWPDATVVNQGRFDPDLLIASRARANGLNYRMEVPEFLNLRRAGLRPYTRERLTPEEDAEIGYTALNRKMAEQADALHIFGERQGPQHAMARAFSEAEKEIHEWGELA